MLLFLAVLGFSLGCTGRSRHCAKLHKMSYWGSLSSLTESVSALATPLKEATANLANSAADLLDAADEQAASMLSLDAEEGEDEVEVPWSAEADPRQEEGHPEPLDAATFESPRNHYKQENVALKKMMKEILKENEDLKRQSTEEENPMTPAAVVEGKKLSSEDLCDSSTSDVSKLTADLKAKERLAGLLNHDLEEARETMRAQKSELESMAVKQAKLVERAKRAKDDAAAVMRLNQKKFEKREAVYKKRIEELESQTATGTPDDSEKVAEQLKRDHAAALQSLQDEHSKSMAAVRAAMQMDFEATHTGTVESHEQEKARLRKDHEESLAALQRARDEEIHNAVELVKKEYQRKSENNQKEKEQEMKRFKIDVERRHDEIKKELLFNHEAETKIHLAKCASLEDELKELRAHYAAKKSDEVEDAKRALLMAQDDVQKWKVKYDAAHAKTEELEVKYEDAMQLAKEMGASKQTEGDNMAALKDKLKADFEGKMKETLLEYEEKISVLHLELDSLNSKATESTAMVERLEAELETATASHASEIDTMKTKYASLETQSNTMLLEQTNTLKEALRKAQETTAAFEKDLTKERENTVSLGKDLRAAQEASASLEKAVSQEQQKCALVEQELAEVHALASKGDADSEALKKQYEGKKKALIKKHAAALASQQERATAELKKCNTEWESKMKEHEAEHANIQSKLNEDLQTVLASREELIATHAAECKDLGTKHAETLKQKLAALQAMHSEEIKRHQSLVEQKVDDAKRGVASDASVMQKKHLEEVKKIKQEHARVITESAERARAELVGYQSRHDKLIQEHDRTIQDIKAEHEKVIADEMAKAKSEIEALNKSNQASHAKLKEEALATLKQKHEADVKMHVDRIAALEQDLDAVRHELRQGHHNVNSLKQEHAGMVEQLKSEQEKVEAEMLRYETKCADMSAAHAIELSKAQEEVVRFQTLASQHSADMEKAESSFSAHKREMDALKTNIVALEQSQQEQKEQKEKCERSLKKAQAIAMHHKQALDRTQEEFAAEMESAKQKLAEEFAAKESQGKTEFSLALTAVRNVLRDDTGDQIEGVASYTDMIHIITQKVSDVEEENIRLQRQVEQLKAMGKHHQEELGRAQEQFEEELRLEKEVRMKLTMSVEDTKTLQSQIIEKEKKLQHVEDQLKKAEAIVLHHKQALDHAQEEQKKELDHAKNTFAEETASLVSKHEMALSQLRQTLVASSAFLGKTAVKKDSEGELAERESLMTAKHRKEIQALQAKYLAQQKDAVELALKAVSDDHKNYVNTLTDDHSVHCTSLENEIVHLKEQLRLTKEDLSVTKKSLKTMSEMRMEEAVVKVDAAPTQRRPKGSIDIESGFAVGLDDDPSSKNKQRAFLKEILMASRGMSNNTRLISGIYLALLHLAFLLMLFRGSGGNTKVG